MESAPELTGALAIAPTVDGLAIAKQPPKPSRREGKKLRQQQRQMESTVAASNGNEQVAEPLHSIAAFDGHEQVASSCSAATTPASVAPVTYIAMHEMMEAIERLPKLVPVAFPANNTVDVLKSELCSTQQQAETLQSDLAAKDHVLQMELSSAQQQAELAAAQQHNAHDLELEIAEKDRVIQHLEQDAKSAADKCQPAADLELKCYEFEEAAMQQQQQVTLQSCDLRLAHAELVSLQHKLDKQTGIAEFHQHCHVEVEAIHKAQQCEIEMLTQRLEELHALSRTH